MPKNRQRIQKQGPGTVQARFGSDPASTGLQVSGFGRDALAPNVFARLLAATSGGRRAPDQPGMEEAKEQASGWRQIFLGFRNRRIAATLRVSRLAPAAPYPEYIALS